MKQIIFKKMLAASALAVATIASPAMAGPTTASGIITSTYLSGGGNYAFRIYLSQNGVDQLSACQADFAYLNTSDDNYQAKVANLMSAYSMQKKITLSYIYTDANGFCRVQDFAVGS